MTRGGVIAVLLLVGGGVAFAAVAGVRDGSAHGADARDVAAVARGRPVYQANCAGCHGRFLQGQALWQLADAAARRRAPAQDRTGHSWQHSDEALFHMVAFGRFDGPPDPSASAMPTFAGVLAETDMLATIAYIKASWPIGLQLQQARLNPGQPWVTPPGSESDWRFPPDCMGGEQRSRRRTPDRTPGVVSPPLRR